jgi:hypothetical protein
MHGNQTLREFQAHRQRCLLQGSTAIPSKAPERAKLSLILSCCGLATPLFVGSIAGIIFGHLAMREFRRNPHLEGRRMAKWGLIIGYGWIAVCPLVLMVFVLLLAGRH